MEQMLTRLPGQTDGPPPAAAYVCCSRPETQGALGLGAEGWASRLWDKG